VPAGCFLISPVARRIRDASMLQAVESEAVHFGDDARFDSSAHEILKGIAESGLDHYFGCTRDREPDLLDLRQPLSGPGPPIAGDVKSGAPRSRRIDRAIPVTPPPQSTLHRPEERLRYTSPVQWNHPSLPSRLHMTSRIVSETDEAVIASLSLPDLNHEIQRCLRGYIVSR